MKAMSIIRLSFRIQQRQKRLFIQSFLLYLMMMLFFPLIWPNDPVLLKKIFPGLFWIALLFSFFLSTDQLFLTDREDGVLEQWNFIPRGLELWVGATLFYHWLFQILPILLTLPFITLLFHLPFKAVGWIILDILCATPALLMGCALSSACIGSVPEKGGLMVLLIFPFLLPILIFGSGLIQWLIAGINITGILALLLAFSLVTSLFFPFLIAFFLKEA